MIYNIPDIKEVKDITNRHTKGANPNLALEENLALKEARDREDYIANIVTRVSRKIRRAARKGKTEVCAKFYRFDDKAPFCNTYEVNRELDKIFKPRGYYVQCYHCPETTMFYDSLLVKVSWDVEA